MPTCDGGTVLPVRPCDAMTSAAVPVAEPVGSPLCPENDAPTTINATNVSRLSAISFLPRDTGDSFCRITSFHGSEPAPHRGTYDDRVARGSRQFERYVNKSAAVPRARGLSGPDLFT